MAGPSAVVHRAHVRARWGSGLARSLAAEI